MGVGFGEEEKAHDVDVNLSVFLPTHCTAQLPLASQNYLGSTFENIQTSSNNTQLLAIA